MSARKPLAAVPGTPQAPITHLPVYAQIAAQLRTAILTGEYEATDEDSSGAQLPSTAALGAQYGVSNKTAARAVQQLVSEGLVTARSGMRPVVIPQADRPARWAMTGRYARARGGKGLVFGGDMQGRDIEKRTTDTGWTAASPQIAALLGCEPGEQVWRREREMLIAGRVAELSASYFPAAIARATPDLMSDGSFPDGGVVGVLERAGHRIARTHNEVRARPAAEHEQALGGGHVLEVAHATYGMFGEPLEAVISVRPAAGNVITFETSETDDPT